MEAFLRYVRHIMGLTAFLGAAAVVLILLFLPSAATPGADGAAPAALPWYDNPTAWSVALGLVVGLLNFRFVDVRAIQLCVADPKRVHVIQILKLAKTLAIFGIVLYPALFANPFVPEGRLVPIPLLLGLLAPRMVLSVDSVLRPRTLAHPQTAELAEAEGEADEPPDADAAPSPTAGPGA